MSEKIYKEIGAGGAIQYFNEHNQYHRLDGPAVEYPNGERAWCQNGQYHRLDGPAIEHANGTKEWWESGKLHRTDGPAIEQADGTKYWCQNDQYHRLDGPAVEYPNGQKSWYRNGIHIKNCYPKTITIIEDKKEKKVSICCIDCVRLYKNISEEKFYKLSLLL